MDPVDSFLDAGTGPNNDTRPIDVAIIDEGVSGPVAAFARSLYQQESGGGKNTATSNRGAVGGMQIQPATFKSVADKDWSIDNPVQNARAGVRYAKEMYEKANGNVKLAAAGYYGGMGGLEKAKQGVPVSDPVNPKNPDTLQYGAQVAARAANDPTAAIDSFLGPGPQTPAAPQTPAPATTPQANPVAQPQSTPTQPAKPLTMGDHVAAALNDAGGLPGALRTGAKVLGEVLLETPLSMISGLVGGVAGGIAGAARTVAPMLALRPPNPQAGEEVNQTVQNAVQYEPRTQAGGAIPHLLGAAAGAANTALGKGAVYVDKAMGSPISENAAQTIGENLLPVAGALAGAESLRAKMADAHSVSPTYTQDQRAVQSTQNSGFMVNPARANPSRLNKNIESAVGQGADAELALKNQPVVTAKAKEALGLPQTTDLTPDVFRQYRDDQYSKGYAPLIGYMKPFGPDAKFDKVISNLDAKERVAKEQAPELVGDTGTQTIKSALLDPKSVENPGMFTAQGVMQISRRLRSQASATFKAERNGNATAEQVDLAHARREAADALEDQLSRTLKKRGDFELHKQFTAARRAIAMSHDVEAATNTATGHVNPQILVNLAKKGRPLSGGLKEIADAAKTSPETVRSTERLAPAAALKLSDVGFAGSVARVVHNPLYAGAALVRPVTRAAYTSKWYQNMAGRPKGVTPPAFSMGGAALGGAAAAAANKNQNQ